MVINKKVTGTALSLPTGIGCGLLVSVAMTMLGCALISYLMVTERIQEEMIGYGSMISLIASSFTGCLLSANLIKRMRFQVCMLTGVGYYIFLLACNALFFGGQYSGMMVVALMVFLGSGCASFFRILNKTGSKLKIKKTSYR